MNYSTRIKIAAVLSLAIHAAGFALLHQNYVSDEYSPAVATEPIVIDLQPDAPAPPEPDEPRQLVDVNTPAESMPDSTDRIAEVFSEAMDLASVQSNTKSPALEQSDFDALPSPASPPTPPETPAPAPEEKEDPEEKTEEEEPKEAEATDKAGKAPEEEKLDAPAEKLLSESEAPGPAEQASDAPIKIAQAQALMPKRPEKGKSRERGGVSKQGQTNFDAIQSEIAPYLKHIRQRVEQQWNQMLYTRYSGTSPVKAVIDCAINPQGELVSVTVVGTDNDKLYSALCRDAVQRAGPFGVFPFEVPDLYRGKNLEIRWTFSFL